MTDFAQFVLAGSTIQEVGGAYNEVISKLPPERKKRLSAILKDSFGAYGLDGVVERFKNRTIAQIFAEYQPVNRKPIASGEQDGVRYALYDPSEKSRDQKP
jgi:hypothetical protein